jgi:RecA-family ATPase
MQAHEVEEIPNITWYLDSVDLRDEGGVDALLGELERRFPSRPELIDDDVVDFGGMDLKLVVFDTLSRNFGGQDENASAAMTSFITGLEIFTRKHDATVLTVHHTNALGERERGHSSLKGAMDVALHCTARYDDSDRLEYIILTTNKQKDHEAEPSIRLSPREDEDGNPITSLVLALERNAQHVVDEVVKAVGSGKVSTKEIEQTLRDSPYSRALIRQGLKDAVKDKRLIVSRGQGHTHLYQQPRKNFAYKVAG